MIKLKKTKKFSVLLSVILALVCLCTAVTVVLASSNKFTFYPDSDLSKEKATILMDELNKKDFSELINEVNKLQQSRDEEEKIAYYYDAIKNKLPETAVSKITAELLDNKNTDDTKINLMILCDSENIKLDYEELLPLLDDNASVSVKNMVIDLIAKDGEAFIDVIEEQALSADDSSVIKSLTLLANLEAEKAEEIADDILSDLTVVFSERHKAALLTKANLLRENATQKEINSFISLCDNIISNMPADNKEEKEIAVIYALSAMQIKETLSYLIKLDNDTAESFRAYVTEENRTVVDNIFDMPADAENVELLLQVAPYYVPKEDFVKKANDYSEKNSEFFAKYPEYQVCLEEMIK